MSSEEASATATARLRRHAVVPGAPGSPCADPPAAAGGASTTGESSDALGAPPRSSVVSLTNGPSMILGRLGEPARPFDPLQRPPLGPELIRAALIAAECPRFPQRLAFLRASLCPQAREMSLVAPPRLYLSPASPYLSLPPGCRAPQLDHYIPTYALTSHYPPPPPPPHPPSPLPSPFLPLRAPPCLASIASTSCPLRIRPAPGMPIVCAIRCNSGMSSEERPVPPRLRDLDVDAIVPGAPGSPCADPPAAAGGAEILTGESSDALGAPPRSSVVSLTNGPSMILGRLGEPARPFDPIQRPPLGPELIRAALIAAECPRFPQRLAFLRASLCVRKLGR